jgi:hypothetical protein
MTIPRVASPVPQRSESSAAAGPAAANAIASAFKNKMAIRSSTHALHRRAAAADEIESRPKYSHRPRRDETANREIAREKA